MKTLQTLSATLGLLALSISASAQMNTLTQTTLSGAITASQRVIPVTSATGINVTSLSGGVIGSTLYIISPGNKGEAVRVMSVSGTSVTVNRSQSGAVAHANGDLVMIGQPNWFYTSDPSGACVTASTYVAPWVNVATGSEWICSPVTLSWVPGWGNSVTEPAVTAAVASAAGAITPSGPLFHVTGTAAITDFTIPIGFAYGRFCIIPDAAYTTTATNKIALASTGVVNKLQCWSYDSSAGKFFPTY